MGSIFSSLQSLLSPDTLFIWYNMALQPDLKPFIVAGAHDAPHTLDIFMDFICPYSAKMGTAIETVLKPAFAPGGKFGGKVKVILRQQLQPWHGSGLFLHEAALAVARVAPDHLWAYCLLLWKHQLEYMDEEASVLTPLQVREKLIGLAAEVIGKEKASEVKKLLEFRPHRMRNGGVSTSEEIRYVVRFGRQNGIHVSPTVMWDGLITEEPQSSWGEQQWMEFLTRKVIV
ncbi:hypothetical protein EUX98_g3718 [Antrodiella citrinella]|uniref:Thioredoxin-like fold domain-containing protein n=1 Tax=Antrodiella citrinella TaxID=2447956 RepID=A0A4S4MYM1_9APHY|nr:hypothetical protein EUX98_g3718 [Antrodiella citrinella]